MECIDVLLRAGADRSIRDMNGKTALDAAVEAGREDCARALNLETGGATVGFKRYLQYKLGSSPYVCWLLDRNTRGTLTNA